MTVFLYLFCFWNLLRGQGWGVPGYATYVSCNAPEAGRLNSHADPVCICACYADRLIAMQVRFEPLPPSFSFIVLHCWSHIC